LIKSVPRLDKPQKGKLFSIEGQPPNVIDLPDCCPFHPRCKQAMDICRKKYPAVTPLGEKRCVSCWLFKEDN
jgi:oligopeptide transport system ATP-binding protein